MSERLTVGVAARLSRYLQVLTQAKKMGRSSISSQDVSEYTHINATQIRRDLSAFGKFGKRGVGYNIDAADRRDPRDPAHSGQHNIALIGAGRLGQAIAGSSIFADHGFHIVTIFDDDPAKIGTELGGVGVRSTGDLTLAGGRAQHHRRRDRRPGGRRADRRRSARAGRRAHHLQLLRGASADARRCRRAQLQPGRRATARALLLPHVGRRPPRRSAERPGELEHGEGQRAARPHRPVDQPRRRPVPGEGSTTAAIAPRCAIGQISPRLEGECAGNLAPMGQHPRPVAGAGRGASATSTVAGSHPRDRGGVPDRRPGTGLVTRFAEVERTDATPLGEHTAGELISSEIEVKRR